jgi:hypothetical protein
MKQHRHKIVLLTTLFKIKFSGFLTILPSFSMKTLKFIGYLLVIHLIYHRLRHRNGIESVLVMASNN